ncbi:MAG: hypothetical protein HUJ75_05145, partial [Parasporobacterium sp.]|nr:hypothetical protein [Parasporobacterium sp.]
EAPAEEVTEEAAPVTLAEEVPVVEVPEEAAPEVPAEEASENTEE